MIEPTELAMTMLRLQTQRVGRVVEGLTFFKFVLVPVQEKVVLDRIVVSDEGVRQLALASE
jgi:hypothetical protein